MQSSLFNADLLNGYRASKVYHMLIDSNASIFKALNYVASLLILHGVIRLSLGMLMLILVTVL